MASFGARLKQEREKRGVTLEEISLSTKISVRFLRALEEEHFEQLPGGVFNKGFVRSYARHLGLDEKEAVADYLIAAGENLPPPPPEAAIVTEVSETEVAPRKGIAHRITWGTLALALLLLAFGFAIWGFSVRESPSRKAGPSAGSGAGPSAPKPESVQPAENAPRPGMGSQQPEALPSPPPQPVKLPAASAEKAPTNAALLVATPTPGTFTVRIKAEEDCWLSITADGTKVMEDTLVASGEKTITASRDISIKAGNLGAVTLWFNGKQLAPEGAYGEVGNLVFDAGGLRSNLDRTRAVAPGP